MSGWRVARPEELARIWPAVRTRHAISSAEELREVYATSPWSIRVSEHGDVMVLRPWRAHLNALAITVIVAPEHRMPGLVTEARATARTQGYDSIVSPLTPASRLHPYTAAGMREVRPIVALQGTPSRAVVLLPETAVPTVRRARHTDLATLLDVDAECFDEFWRYGREEFDDLMERDRVAVAHEGGEVLGYVSCSRAGSACTIGRLAVAASARRRGLGRALLRNAAEWAHGSGAVVLSLCTQEQNAASRALYRKAGLVEVEEPYAIVVGASGVDTHAGT